MNAELAETLELTRRIPCRDDNDQKMQEQIEFCVGKLQQRADCLSEFWQEYKRLRKSELSSEEFNEVSRNTIEGDQLAETLREMVLARLVFAGWTPSLVEMA